MTPTATISATDCVLAAAKNRMPLTKIRQKVRMPPARPMPALPIRFSPQVCLSAPALRFTASTGPTSCAASTGTTRKVATVQPKPIRPTTMTADEAEAFLQRAQDHARPLRRSGRNR